MTVFLKLFCLCDVIISIYNALMMCALCDLVAINSGIHNKDYFYYYYYTDFYFIIITQMLKIALFYTLCLFVCFTRAHFVIVSWAVELAHK
jgi:hypothetical protein